MKYFVILILTLCLGLMQTAVADPLERPNELTIHGAIGEFENVEDMEHYRLTLRRSLVNQGRLISMGRFVLNTMSIR